jgi:hypothetical protein
MYIAFWSENLTEISHAWEDNIKTDYKEKMCRLNTFGWGQGTAFLVNMVMNVSVQ